jgi:hypothetical protein
VAIYIPIRKLRETDREVEYSYASDSDEEIKGRFLLDKATGAFTLIEAIPGEKDESFFSRAARKISRYWASGDFPDFTSYSA